MGIPEPKISVEAGQIPLKSAELPQSDIEPELRPYLISFQRYNEKECQVDTMEPKVARKALKVVRDIGINIREEADFQSRLPKLTIAPVTDAGDYRDLFKGLRDLPDIDMKEAKVDNNTGRLFFFIINKIFHVVAIRDAHYDTSKTR